ncbi:MAG: hypothetical protein L6Q84_27500 [Polyangiaceae bacterium]|nr:hypothetical protein [Polyangiaceae bacterium]
MKVIFIMNRVAPRLLTALLFAATPAFADDDRRVELGGYGEIHLSHHDYGPDPTGAHGSSKASRNVFDTTRFVLEVEGELPGDFEFEAEVEFEHGGTGAAMELEYEEFGEYETEVERGGEVVLEELYLEKKFGKRFSLKAGRFYVAVGMLSFFYQPTQYLGLARPESETTVLPAVWDEIGISATAKLGPVELRAQVVNGLDSTGFSSQRWVASGHQARFEETRAKDLAVVGRADFVGVKGVMLGASAYFGNTTGNRPKPDMKGVSAPLLIVDAHGSLDLAPLRARGCLIWGKLKNAGAITEKNSRLSNNLQVLRSPVAEQALAAWVELGANAAPALALSTDHRVEPFVRVEHYDTMFEVGPGRFDNPRFERLIYSAGLGYTYRDAVVTKLGMTHRKLGSAALNSENTVGLALGFVY